MSHSHRLIGHLTKLNLPLVFAVYRHQDNDIAKFDRIAEKIDEILSASSQLSFILAMLIRLKWQTKKEKTVLTYHNLRADLHRG